MEQGNKAAGVWVKASEILPNNHTPLFFKIIRGEGATGHYGFFDGKFYSQNQNGYFGMELNNSDTYIEWLDESQANNSIDNGWISVEDKMPEDCNEILGCHCNEQYYVVEVCRKYHSITPKSYKFVSRDGDSGLNITHWQPLPKRPNKK